MKPSLRCHLCLCIWVLGVLPACTSLDKVSHRVTTVVTPYKIDIVQGNFVSREQVAALQLGMRRLQVRDILGTPLLASVFHSDRWDYVFTFKRQGLEPQARRVTVFFENDILMRIDADALPSEAEFVASLDSGRSSDPVPDLEISPDSPTTSLPPSTPVETPTLPPLPSGYPPLEASEH